MRRIAFAALLLSTAVAVGCSADGQGSDAGSAGSGGSGGADSRAADTARGEAVDLTKAGSLGRQQIRTAAMEVRVADVAEATRAAVRTAEAAGGFLESERTEGERTTLTVRVPPEEFTATGEAYARLGTVTARTVDTEDVTGDVADVAGRLKAARASTDRVRALLARASGIAEVTAIEAELNEREAALESLESRRRALAARTSYAAVTATFTKPAAAAVEPVAATGFTGGLRAGWRVFRGSAAVLLVVLGAVLPFLPLVALSVWAARRKVSARA